MTDNEESAPSLSLSPAAAPDSSLSPSPSPLLSTLSPPLSPPSPPTRVIPLGFVACDQCDELIPKTTVAQHESTICSQSLSDCLLSRNHHDLCHLHPSPSSPDDDDLTRSDISHHIESSVGQHVLYLMDLIDRLQLTVTSLTTELAIEKKRREEMEEQIKSVITRLAEKVDHAQVAHFTTPSYHHPIPSTIRTTSGRVVQRRHDRDDDYPLTFRSTIQYEPPPSPPTQPLKPSPSAWQPKPSPSSSTPSTSLDIPSYPLLLTKKIHSTLNKLTPTTFDRLSSYLLALFQSVSDEGMLQRLTVHVFDKALSDIFFGRLYATLCKQLSDGMKEWKGGGKGFRWCLLNKCQEEFEKGRKHVKRAEDQTVEVKEEKEEGEVDEEKERVDEADKSLIEAASKRRMIANVRFIGELFLCDLIPPSIMIACAHQLLSQVQLEQGEQSEEAVQGLTSLLWTVGKRLDEEVGGLMMKVWDEIEKEVKGGKHSSRGKFALMGVLEGRVEGWKEREGQKGQSATGGKLEGGGGRGDGEGGGHHQGVIRVGFGGVEYEGGKSQQSKEERVVMRVEREKERERDRELIPHLTAGERKQQATAMAMTVTKWQPGVKKKPTPTTSTS